jgi:hypothetical protein
MLFSIVVLPLAQSDIQSASEWYENKQTGLGSRFEEQVIAAIDSIF